MINCPCCDQVVAAPSLDQLVADRNISGHDEAILRVVWCGDGMPVRTERIFDAMYADDPDGGPSPQQIYRDFKIALSRLRDRIEGSGVAIQNAGFRCGFRLTFDEVTDGPRS